MKNQLLALLIVVPTVTGVAQHTMCFNPSPKIDAAQLKCLATTVYGEARGESDKGQVAVAYTVVNRAKNKTLCQVALANKQYSVFNNNPELRAAATSLHIDPKQKNIIDQKSWDNAVRIAQAVMQRSIMDPTAGATHYVAYKSLKRIPKWTRQYKVVAKIDNHTFFKV